MHTYNSFKIPPHTHTSFVLHQDFTSLIRGKENSQAEDACGGSHQQDSEQQLWDRLTIILQECFCCLKKQHSSSIGYVSQYLNVTSLQMFNYDDFCKYKLYCF